MISSPTHRTTTRPPLGGVAVLAAIAVLSGCGSTGSGGADGGPGTLAAAAQKGVRFAECMRNHGVPQFPDPDASGRLTIDAVANRSSVDTRAPAFTQAVRACQSLEPAGFTGSKRSPQQQQAGLEFARCIRSSGVPDFPDPTPDGPLIDTNRIPSANRAGGLSALRVAMQRCSAIAAAAGVTR